MKFGKLKQWNKRTRERELLNRRRIPSERMKELRLKTTLLLTGKKVRLDTLSQSLLLSTGRKWLEHLDTTNLLSIGHYWLITWMLKNFRKADLRWELTLNFLAVLQVVRNRKISLVTRQTYVMSLMILSLQQNSQRISSLKNLILFSQNQHTSSLLKFQAENAYSQAKKTTNHPV